MDKEEANNDSKLKLSFKLKQEEKASLVERIEKLRSRCRKIAENKGMSSSFVFHQVIFHSNKYVEKFKRIEEKKNNIKKEMEKQEESNMKILKANKKIEDQIENEKKKRIKLIDELQKQEDGVNLLSLNLFDSH